MRRPKAPKVQRHVEVWMDPTFHNMAIVIPDGPVHFCYSHGEWCRETSVWTPKSVRQSTLPGCRWIFIGEIK